MKWNWLTIPIAIIIISTSVMVLVGSVIPRRALVERHAAYLANNEVIWQSLVDFDSFTIWRTDLLNAWTIQNGEEPSTWGEKTNYGELVLQAIEVSKPSHLVIRIIQSSLHLDGTWVIDLVSKGTGTQVTIKQDIEISNPILRFWVWAIIGKDTSIKTFLSDLGRKLGEVI